MAVTTVFAAGDYISQRQAAAAAHGQTIQATSYRARRKTCRIESCPLFVNAALGTLSAAMLIR
jgi:hypothetical protein